ncbi:MAG: hypothetical protein IPI58_00635 [Alphaproteobacteria bacterium]|nr:MAG: hypothetical protein IPI58_00635 [Alphaproteobacteria bacterium]
MENTTPLPTANPDWGFWGTSVRSGYDAPMVWDAASRVLAEAFNLTQEQTRDLLDARFGRHLADELSFIKGGPTTAQAITDHIKMRIADRKWRGYFNSALREIKAA